MLCCRGRAAAPHPFTAWRRSMLAAPGRMPRRGPPILIRSGGRRIAAVARGAAIELRPTSGEAAAVPESAQQHQQPPQRQQQQQPKQQQQSYNHIQAEEPWLISRLRPSSPHAAAAAGALLLCAAAAAAALAVPRLARVAAGPQAASVADDATRRTSQHSDETVVAAAAQGGARAGSQLQSLQPRGDEGWWRSLARVHYVDCGAAGAGAQPRLALDLEWRPLAAAAAVALPGQPPAQQPSLVGFEDAADAELAADAFRRQASSGGVDDGSSSSSGSAASSVRVVEVPPGAFADVAAAAGARPEVLRRGLVRRAAPVGPDALALVLQELLATRQPRDGSMSALPPFATSGGAAAAASRAAAARGQARMRRAGSGFAPVTTDLPELLRASLDALPGGVATAAAAVSADAAAAAVSRAEAEAPDGAAVLVGSSTVESSSSTSTTSSSSSSVASIKAEQPLEVAAAVAPAFAVAADQPAAGGHGEAEEGAGPRDEPEMLLAEFRALEAAAQQSGTSKWDDTTDEGGVVVVDGYAAAPLAAMNVGTSGTGGASSAHSVPAGASGFGSDADADAVQALSKRVEALVRRRGDDDGSGSSSSGGGSSAGVAHDLADAQSELHALRARVGDRVEQAVAAAGVVAPDGRVDRAAGLTAIARLQGALEALRGAQRELEAAAAAAGVQLPGPPPGPRAADRVRLALGVTPEDEARLEREVAGAARATAASGGPSFSWRSSSTSTGSRSDATATPAGAVPPVTGADGGSNTNSSSNGGGGGTTSGSSSSTAGRTVPSGADGSGKRPWGAWGPKPSTSGSSISSSSTAAAPIEAETVSAPAALAAESVEAAARTKAASNNADDEGVAVVSKRIGSTRPPPAPTDPQTRQANVREALRLASEQWQNPAQRRSSSSVDGVDDGVPPELLGSSGDSSGRRPWWVARFQALFLPTMAYADGGVGFVQVDVALAGVGGAGGGGGGGGGAAGCGDVRVLAFEDRHDCMHCLAVMAEWPEFRGVRLTMAAAPTATLERDIRASWLAQREQAQLRRWASPAGGGDGGGAAGSATMAGPAPKEPSPPSGVAVFRRGKLRLSRGMGRDAFMEAVVYQAAAQDALGRIGYGFSD